MEKTGRKNRKYSAEFKKCVIMDMRERRSSYHETVRKHWGTKTHSEDCKYIKAVKRWIRYNIFRKNKKEPKRYRHAHKTLVE